MKLKSPQKEMYAKERLTALQAQRLAQEIAFGPIVFQVSRLMVKFGILKMLDDRKEGMTMTEVAETATYPCPVPEKSIFTLPLPSAAPLLKPESANPGAV